MICKESSQLTFGTAESSRQNFKICPYPGFQQINRFFKYYVSLCGSRTPLFHLRRMKSRSLGLSNRMSAGSHNANICFFDFEKYTLSKLTRYAIKIHPAFSFHSPRRKLTENYYGIILPTRRHGDKPPKVFSL